jgi:outer membrane scaffolding protein for murein synthesis (MipA/OmpV family)
MKKHKFFLFSMTTWFLACALFPNWVYGQPRPEKPLWEVVLFNGAAKVPHYRGADEHEWYVLPLPYLIYRGEFIRANRGGVRGVFFDSEHFETSISLSGVPPVDDNDAREQMPDLDAIFEIGPSLKYHPFGRGYIDSFYLKLAARAAFSLGFDGGVDISYQGLKYGLNLIYFNKSLFENFDLGFGLNAGIDFSNSELHSYYYDVPDKYVRPDRPFYKSDSGYSGVSLAGSVLKKLNDRFSIGFYSRWENLNGAVYKDSPLVKKDNNFTVGAALIWKIIESKKLVRWEE